MRAPRFLVSAAHKSSGKTVISTGLAAAFRARGRRLACFKKGPDYIDPMWLGAAAGAPCYNLDFNVQDARELRDFLARRAAGAEMSLIEANKGLFDGVAADGSDSNAALARLLGLPVVLVIDTTGMTRGIAPLLRGYLDFEPGLEIAGVILNRVGGPRHEAKLRAAVAEHTGLEVVGAVHRHPALEIGERHLGLTTPGESGGLEARIARIGALVADGVDLEALERIAARAPDLPAPSGPPGPAPAAALARPGPRIAIARDRAFGFYYPDDLEAFAGAGAELVAFDTLRDAALPEAIDALFIGGGFPEMFIPELAANTPLLADIRARLGAGLPAYAECGGLMYLSRSIRNGDMAGDMVGLIPGDAVLHPRPQGRGYTRFADLPDHPWGRPGAARPAHEFHYARLENLAPGIPLLRRVERGHGIDGTRDAVLVGNTVAGFIHLRATGADPWVSRFVAFVRESRAGPGSRPGSNDKTPPGAGPCAE